MAKKSSATSQSHDALELLKADHKHVLQLFAEFEKMDKEDEDARRELVERVCNQLTVHAEIEEELFYPALRDVVDEQDLLNEAQVEHDMAKQLIADLESMEPDEDLYDAKFTVLGEYVRHHVEEEEKEIFARAKKAKLDLDTIGADMFDRKKELMAEFGMDIDEEMMQDAQIGEKKSSGKAARHPRAH
ncbi:hemerythrin HHE cation binding domain-containing protein [Paucimonas lemoignei]|uniref:Hemerythrin HHE cation binding domain-containing protein n=1 Tax=Paucimonas lemoignei TaxID=29443 RepID=A0A4R3HQE5_PAULE|nr:hemerythrin domain-containing protein [Paucimonas lemoignei]TCS34677.1 hemerythrin HHE cation binding domain-containing protein [Paucimonas lemoignei]